MLCAVCLETLEEIYPYRLKDRMHKQLADIPEPAEKARYEALRRARRKYLRSPNRMEIRNMLKEGL